jgi:hypothetical protein
MDVVRVLRERSFSPGDEKSRRGEWLDTEARTTADVAIVTTKLKNGKEAASDKKFSRLDKIGYH